MIGQALHFGGGIIVLVVVCCHEPDVPVRNGDFLELGPGGRHIAELFHLSRIEADRVHGAFSFALSGFRIDLKKERADIDRFPVRRKPRERVILAQEIVGAGRRLVLAQGIPAESPPDGFSLRVVDMESIVQGINAVPDGTGRMFRRLLPLSFLGCR